MEATVIIECRNTKMGAFTSVTEHDCEIVHGNYHHLGCDVERCPRCNRQLISCECRRRADRNSAVMKDYVRVKFNEFDRAIWAVKREMSNGLVAYTKCTRSGDTCPGTKVHVIVAGEGDVAWEKPATMNLKYAELEVRNVVG